MENHPWGRFFHAQVKINLTTRLLLCGSQVTWSSQPIRTHVLVGDYIGELIQRVM